MRSILTLGTSRRREGWITPTPISAPTGLAVASSGDSWVVLSCTPRAGADWYEIDYRISGSWITYAAQFTDPAAMVLVNLSAPELLEFRLRAHY